MVRVCEPTALMQMCSAHTLAVLLTCHALVLLTLAVLLTCHALVFLTLAVLRACHAGNAMLMCHAGVLCSCSCAMRVCHALVLTLYADVAWHADVFCTHADMLC